MVLRVTVRDSRLTRIARLAEAFGDEAELFHNTLTIFDFAMIEEENTLPDWHWPMKKRVTNLGFHALLVCGFTPEAAANASRWRSARVNLARLRAYEVDAESRRDAPP